MMKKYILIGFLFVSALQSSTLDINEYKSDIYYGNGISSFPLSSVGMHIKAINDRLCKRSTRGLEEQGKSMINKKIVYL